MADGACEKLFISNHQQTELNMHHSSRLPRWTVASDTSMRTLFSFSILSHLNMRLLIDENADGKKTLLLREVEVSLRWNGGISGPLLVLSPGAVGHLDCRP